LKAPDWQQDSASGSPFGNTAGNPAAPPAADFSASLLFGGTGGLSSGLVSDQSDPSNVGAPPVSSRRSLDAPLPAALQGFFSGLAQPAIGSTDDPAYLVPLADKRKDPHNLDLFDERAFGNTPPLGSAAPRLIPPTGNPRPPTASPQSPPAQAPSAPRASPPAAQAQSTLPGIPPPSGGRVGEPPGSARAGGSGAAASSPAASGAVGGAVTPADSNWRRLADNIERIRDAWAQGGAKLPKAISAALPKYDGKTTYGILITNEGDVVPLQSADADPLFNNYVSAGHVEGKAALWMRDHGSTGGVLYHNNTGGTCAFCNSQLETLLQKVSNLLIIPPADAVATKRGAVEDASYYEGNAALPKLPRQFNLFRRRP
jgi:hypothetical protein